MSHYSRLDIPEEFRSNLLKKLAWLKKYHKDLSKVKNERKAVAENLLQNILKISTRLGSIDNCIENSSEQLLSEDLIHNLRKRLSDLKCLQQDRFIAIKPLADNLNELVQELNLNNLEPIDLEAIKFAITPGDSYIPLDISTKKAIENRIDFLLKEKQNRTQILRELGAKIQPLWDLLDIAEEKKQQFFANNTGLSEKVIQTCRNELDSLLKKKQKKIKEIIQRMRERILNLEHKLGYVKQDNSKIKTLLKDDSFSDLTFDAHQTYLNKLEKQDQVLGPISSKYKKYVELCKVRDVYEEVIKDSTRLLDRRRGISKLREEERQRKIVEKTLPIFVKKILVEGEKYEKLFSCSLSCLQDIRKREQLYKDKKREDKARKRIERISVTPKTNPKNRVNTKSQIKRTFRRVSHNDENMNLLNQYT